jgi:predicted phosphoribosyltransferase
LGADASLPEIVVETMAFFRDRVDAGGQLGQALAAFAGRDDVVVLGVPRGGVPVAEQVAVALRAELDVFVVRKVGVPGQEELAMGAVASGGVRVVNREVVDTLGIDDELFRRAADAEMEEVARREQLYRGDRPPLDLTDKTVILVDDGLATGASMRAAVEAARVHRPAHTIVAVPVAPPSTCEQLRSVADAVICGVTPEPFLSVGQWYDDFSQTTDDEVREALARHRLLPATPEPSAPAG